MSYYLIGCDVFDDSPEGLHLRLLDRGTEVKD